MTEPNAQPGVDSAEALAMLGDKNWRVDKHIPLALILAILVQTATLAWWASGVDHRLDALEHQTVNTNSQSERLVKLETKFDGLIDSVNEIKTLLRAPNHR